MVTPKKIKIGDLLLEEKLISKQQLEEALAEQKENGGKIGDIVIHLGFITEIELLQALANQLHMPFIELQHFTIKPEVVRKIPERIARRYRVLVLDLIDEQYLVGMADPTNVLAYDEVCQILKSKVRVAIVKEIDLLSIVDQVYRRTEDIASFAKELKDELNREEVEDVDQESNAITEDSAPVAKLLDSIFEDAVQIGASDIHIEPDEKVLRIRQRVDGILQEEVLEGKKIVEALVLRIKLIAKLNISERRLPQDGRFKIKVKGRQLDIRVSTMPIRYGESVVMRILDQSKGILSLDQINLRQSVADRVKFNIQRPNGLILVTGPTGSGKTTTLYAVLNELNVTTKKIITIEDPVEYTLPRINQVQINNTIDLSFARVLRTALRQDPEIIMIGEMRDEETTRIGLRASLTGHLVLSTLHTNDSLSTALRLIDMGIEGYLVAAALRMIIAQRLIRKICETCGEDVELTDKERKIVTSLVGHVDEKWKFKRGIGCPRCHNTGYSGRVAIHELLEISPELSQALRSEDSNLFMETAINQKNFTPLAIAAFEYALEGITSLEEVIRVSSELEDIRAKKVNSKEFKIDLSRISI